MEGQRARRRTVKAVDYSKEQEFSDDDIFEDNLKDPAREPTNIAPPPKRQRGRPRKYDPDDGAPIASDDYGVFSSSSAQGKYVEKGYDPSLLAIRERYTFSPEYEEDGSPKIECIVGRRPVKDKSNLLGHASAQEEQKEDNSGDENASETDDQLSDKQTKSRKRGRPRATAKESPPSPSTPVRHKHVEYEYLLKYKGRSYLHLVWKSAPELESMNKSAKTLYRRFLKKLESGLGEDSTTLEDPTFDSSYAQPQKIVDEKEQEVLVELTDRELVEWEKERARELEQEQPIQQHQQQDFIDQHGMPALSTTLEEEDAHHQNNQKDIDDTTDAEHDPTLSPIFPTDPLGVKLKKVRAAVNKDGRYYPCIPGCDNPYRDGYVTTPPKKPRASYLFFQCAHRADYQRRYAGASQGEIMTILGDTWRAMSEEEQEPYLFLAREEALEFEKERQLMERAQKPNEIWQPLRRCSMVLDRLWADGFSNIFHHPVDTTLFPDYEDIIDTPMDLALIKKKLRDRKYQAPEVFARDVRKVWKNCKVYNQHGSAIWHVADYMSKQFERLYHAWVLAFRERYLRWANPLARPWEPSCRKCDGQCGTKDEDMILCDYCDALYGLKCIGLKRIPAGTWHCEECENLSKCGKVRLLSGLAEQAARKRAEMGDVPKKIIKMKMYLVKWAGLGYEHCTWETSEDINDDALIEEFRQFNNMVPEEPDVTEEDLVSILSKMEWPGAVNAAPQTKTSKNGNGGNDVLTDLKNILYAQLRAYHFAKFGQRLPETLGRECGPHSTAQVLASPTHPTEVIQCLSNIVRKVAVGKNSSALSPHITSPLMTGEYDAVIPITAKGLMMNVGEVHGSVAFLGYRQFPDGSKGPAETKRIINNVGDKIVAVDGISTVNKSFKDVIRILRDSGRNKYAYMRFWSNRYQICSTELTSMGTIGQMLIDELKRKFKTERRAILQNRRNRQNVDGEDELGGKESQGEDEDVADDEEAEEDADEEEESEDESDYDADDLIIQQRQKAQIEAQKKLHEQENGVSTEVQCDILGNEDESQEKMPTAISSSSNDVNAMNQADASSVPQPNADVGIEVKSETSNIDSQKGCDQNEIKQEVLPDSLVSNSLSYSSKEESPIEVSKPQESTRSLCLRLLDVDVDYSSDEGGEEDRAYFFDGVDQTFCTKREAEKIQEDEKVAFKGRIKKSELSALGNRSKLCVATLLSTTLEPEISDYDNYPKPSTKAMEAAEAARKEEVKLANATSNEFSDSTKSTSKIEQLSTTTGEVIRVWASPEEAAATLQVPIKKLKSVLKGEYNEDVGDEVGGFRWRYASVDAQVTTGGKAVGGRDSKKGKMAYLEFREKLYSHENPHVYKGGHKLRDYQIDGVNWLASCWYKRHSCILADEMGLGKTVQIVSYVEHLFRVEKIHRPFLVVVPLSTVEHWRREFEGWTEMVCCVYHDRQREWRDVMREYEWYYADRPRTADYLKFHVLVTTYDTLIGDFDVISQIPWRVTVVDEAHRLRNVKGKLLECMKQISAKGILQYGFQSRVLMTGTPLQNNTQELWTLLNFIEPYKFPSLDDFQVAFGNMANREQVEALQKKISPFMLRRVKEDVAKDIPSKEETVIDVELTSIQKQYYRAVFEHNHAFLSMGATRATAPKLMNIQMELRKCCNHPFLLDGVEQREMERYYKELSESGAFDNKAPDEQQKILNDHGYIKSSGKMVLLDKLLPKLKQEGHKVLIFSQMVKMLDLISEYCDFRGFKHERLDGRVRGNERQKAIDRFESEDDSFVFLLSTRAGGVGINLTAADICIIFDSDWNPQNDVQAQARCHRIGQTKDVMIYRLVTSRSFEQEMFDRASKKLGLEQAVLGTFGQDNDDDKPTHKEMEQLLKKGAYALLEDENDDMGKQFCEDDIESILAKRTRTRVVEGAKTASWLNKQGMNVTKSKFTGESAAATANVDVDDPLFWQKVMPDFVTPTIMTSKLNDLIEMADKRQNALENGEAGGPGRGSRKKKLSLKVMEQKTDEKAASDKAQDNETGDNDQGTGPAKSSSKEDKSLAPSRSLLKKSKEFMADLTSMMEGIFEDEEDGNLPQTEKLTCQKLLLTISVKNKIFSEDQRNMAKVLLRRLEGDRKRRCRTTADAGEPSRLSSTGLDAEDAPKNGRVVPEQLLIIGKTKRRKRRTPKDVDEGAMEDEDDNKRKRAVQKGRSTYVEEDGYLHHSDSEGDWSDVGENMYETTKQKRGISRKEARRRRAWACDKDAATAAGRPWPVFPRTVVMKVLGSMLNEVIKNDKAKGGLFSIPVPRDEFPEYYELVKQPMDFGTMKEKLARGEYRSAQAMQKDFVLVLQNCLQFNAPDSNIVKEARRQALGMPALLKNAALEHNLFLCEDGTVLEIYSDDDKEYSEDGDDNDQNKEHSKSLRRKSRKGPRRRKKKNRHEKEISVSKRNILVGGSGHNKRVVRCKECEGCRREDCGKCIACLDKPKFGGKGTLKQGCQLRQCINMHDQTSMTNKASTFKTSDSETDTNRDEKDDNDVQKDENEGTESQSDTESVETASVSSSSAKKPRIRISLALTVGTSARKEKNPEDSIANPTKKRKGRKRSRSTADIIVKNVDDKESEFALNGPEIPRKKTKFSISDGSKSSAVLELSSPTVKIKKKRKKEVKNIDSLKISSQEEHRSSTDKFSTMPKIPKKNDVTKKAGASETTEVSDSDNDSRLTSPNHDLSTSQSRKTSRRCSQPPVRKPTKGENDPSSALIDIDRIKNERAILDNSFSLCRNHFIKRGPWILPKSVGEDKYYDVARHTLNKMCRHDTYNLFAEKVSDDEAPGYSTVIKNPMDFGTMRSKLESGAYGKGSKALSGLYSDFLLVMDNCALYNEEDSDVAREAARIMSLLPEVFASACAAVSDKIKKKKRKKSVA